jgi:hypothetical protein
MIFESTDDILLKWNNHVVDRSQNYGDRNRQCISVINYYVISSSERSGGRFSSRGDGGKGRVRSTLLFTLHFEKMLFGIADENEDSIPINALQGSVLRAIECVGGRPSPNKLVLHIISIYCTLTQICRDIYINCNKKVENNQHLTCLKWKHPKVSP